MSRIIDGLNEVRGIPAHMRHEFFQYDVHDHIAQHKASLLAFPGGRSVEVRGDVTVFCEKEDQTHYFFMWKIYAVIQDAHKKDECISKEGSKNHDVVVYEMVSDDPIPVYEAYFQFSTDFNERMMDIWECFHQKMGELPLKPPPKPPEDEVFALPDNKRLE